MALSYAEHKENLMFILESLNDLQPLISRIKEPMLRETLQHGVGYLHELLTFADQDIVRTIFIAGYIRVCVISSSMCWGVSLRAQLVVIMGTEYYDGRGNANTDYPITDVLQMMGQAGRFRVDNSGKCVIFCRARREDYKFLPEALPVESHMHHYLHNNLNSEVVTRVISSKKNAMDYLTWTFMYRRLTQNPNYYNIKSSSQIHISDYLLELVLNTLRDLETSKCVAIEDDFVLKPLNHGIMASYHSISHMTIELFSSSISAGMTLKGLLEILASASEFEQLPVRPWEAKLIQSLIEKQRFSFGNPKCNDPHVKAHALLQAHFSRHVVHRDLLSDQKEVLKSASKLVQAVVDVISSNGWLSLALLAMEVSQMVIQGMWEQDSLLLQLPHFTKYLVKRCQENHRKCISTVFDLVEMEYDERRDLLQMSNLQLSEVEKCCTRFPNIGLTYFILNGDSVRTDHEIRLQVSLERHVEEVGAVYAPRYPKFKEEGWWLVVGDMECDLLLAMKRVVPLQRQSKVELNFSAGSNTGKHIYALYFVCDSYKGFDQKYCFSVDVK